MAEAAAQQLPGDDWKDIHPAEAQASPYTHGDDWHDIAPPVSLDEFAGPKVTGTPLYKAGESIQKFGREAFPVSEEERAAHPYASAIGRTAGAVLPAAAATLGLGPAGALAGAAQMGTSAEADTFDDALAHGADERTASKAAGISGALGMALGAVDLGVVLAPLRRSLPGMSGWAAQKLAQAGQSGVTFAAVGQAQQYLNTEIEKEIYNPDATYSPQFKDMLAAFVVGGGLGAVHPLRPREMAPATDVSNVANGQQAVIPPEGAPASTEGRLEAPPEPAVAPPPLAEAVPAATRESLREALDRGAPLSELVQHPYVRHVDEQNKNAVPTGTEEDFANPDWRANRVYDFNAKEFGAAATTEPVKGWDAAVERLTDHAKLYAGPEGVENGRHAIIIIGPPAAGKSGTAVPMARTFRAAIVDADDAKLAIPEYQGGLGTDAVHEESSYMAKDVAGRFFDDGANVVLPKVGQNADKIANLVKVLQERLGYKVDLVHVASTPEISGRRNIERLLNTGRLVSPDFIAQVGDKPRETYHLLKGEADDFADINTAVDPRETREASAGLAHAISDGRNLVEDHVAGGDRGRGAQGAAREEAQVKSSVHDQGLQADKVDLPTQALLDRLGLPHSIEELRPQDIGADPARFQYKAGADTATGETKAGAISIGRWKGQRTPAMVWRDNDGKDWIVDGHHRLNVGKKLANIDPSVRLGAIVINEADISAADAKALGQQRNEAREASKLSGIQQHRVTAADGTSAEVFPLVIEADRAITSQDAGYDQTLQPRQRSRAASQAQVRDIATNLDPERLGYSAEADRGSPIIGPDGMVESGNGRVLAVRRVYEQDGPQAQAYRDWLMGQGVDVSKFRNPILVRQRLTPFTPEQRRAFTVAANQPATLAMSAPERAMADARLIDSNSLSLIVNPDDLGRNRDFVRRFIAQLPQTEQGAMADAHGALSAEGATRIRNAVLARAYSDTGVLTRIAESTNDEIKSISNAMVGAAPRWARMRAEVEAGNVRPDVDLTPDLIEAVKRTADIRAKGQKLNDYLAQQDAFDKLPDTVEAFMRNFYDPKGRRAASAERIRDTLRFYADEAAKVSVDKGLDLGLVKVEPRDILNLAQKKGWEGLPVGRAEERDAAKMLSVANKVVSEWQSKLRSDIKVVMGGSLVSRTFVRTKKGEPIDMDIRFLTENPERDYPKVEAVTGLKLKKSRPMDDYPSGSSTGYLVEGPLTRDGYTFDVEAAVRTPAYVGWARFYPTVLTPDELSAFRADKARLKGDKEAYKALKLSVLTEVKKRVEGLGGPRAVEEGDDHGRQGRDAERGGAGDGQGEPAGGAEARGPFLAPGREYTGTEGAEGHPEAAERAQRPERPRDLISEREREGQLGLPGAGRITSAQLAQRRANEPLRPRVEQEAPGGLFAHQGRQLELEDFINAVSDKAQRPDATGNEDLAYLLGPKSGVGVIGKETGTVKPNGVSLLTVANSPKGYEGHRLVSSKDGKIVGAMQVMKAPNAGHTVANTFVDPAYRRQGIATALNAEAKNRFGELSRSEGPSEAGGAFRTSLVGAEMAQRAEVVPPFYSAVSRAIDSAKQSKAAPQQWLGMLKNAPGVKQEEMEWLGLNEWLRDQKGSVTKEQIADYVRANQIEVKEVEKGTPVQRPYDNLSDDEHQQLADEYEAEKGHPPRYMGLVQDWYEGERASNLENTGDPTKFSQYTLEGGENHRELLLTLPPKESDTSLVAAHKAASRERADAMKAMRDAFEQFDRDDPRADEAYRRWVEAKNKLDELTEQLKEKSEGEFRVPAGHGYGDTASDVNRLAHIFMDDRVIDGKRTLLLKEVQSDWHQQGRKAGYKPSEAEYQDKQDAFKKQLEDITRELALAPSHERQVELYKRQSEIIDQYNALHDAHRDGVPDAPFKTTWPELVMKRMIRYAAENGYDKLAWVPGEERAAQYDLSKQISRLEYKRIPTFENQEPRWVINAFDHQGNGVLKQSASAKELPDIIGKELAEKIANDKAHEGEFSGLDLKVGGEGMHGFYDQILPAVVNKLTKKYGAKVDHGSLEGAGVPENQNLRAGHRDIVIQHEEDGTISVRNTRTDEVYGDKLSYEEAIKLAERLRLKPVPVHTLDITDKLKDVATQEGFPLFKTPSGWEAAEGHGEPQGQKIRIGRDTYAYLNQKYSAKEQEIANAVVDIGARMAPKANIKGVAALRQSGATIWGGFVNSAAFPQLITWSLEKGGAGQIGQTVRHEIIHHLRNMGLFAPDEWKALRDAAVHDGWLQQHNIYDRYPDLSSDHKIEEAVAEQFGKWRAERSLVKPGPIRDAFMRLDLFLRRVAAVVRKAMGFKATPSDIFTRIETGEVGRREPVKRASGGRIESGTGKRTRDSFGYMEPSPNIPDFAQCGSCRLWIKDRDRCYWFSDSKKVEASDSCTEYVQGEPIKGDVKATNSLDPKEAGFIKGSTRCENCVSFNKDKSSCILFEKLNRAQPDIFDLDEKVRPRGCCNAFSRDPATHEKVVRRASGGRVMSHYIDRNPSEAQKRAGNYRHAHINVHGLDISIENAKGHERSGVGKDGKPWKVQLPANYGYIKRTEGADGDHVDCYVGRHPKSRQVFIVDQHDADTGKFDEHKCLLGFASEKQARDVYHRGFSDGRGKDRLGHLTEMDIDQFKHWLDGDTRNPVNGTAHAPKVDTTKDVRWMSEMSKSGDTYYRDRSLPKQIVNNGKWLPIDEPLKRHEVAEYNAIKKMIADFEAKHGRKPNDAEREAIYLKCHKEHGEVAEHNWLRENGFDVKAWEGWCRGKLAHLEHKRIVKPPPNPHVRPSPHDRRRLETVM